LRDNLTTCRVTVGVHEHAFTATGVEHVVRIIQREHVAEGELNGQRTVD